MKVLSKIALVLLALTGSAFFVFGVLPLILGLVFTIITGSFVFVVIALCIFVFGMTAYKITGFIKTHTRKGDIFYD